MLFNYSSLWTGPTVTSPFHFFEGRFALVESLGERIKEAPNHEARETIMKVMQKFDEISQNWKDDFSDKYDSSIIEGHDNNKKIELAEACRKVFDWTTGYFQGKGLEEDKNGKHETKDTIEPELPQNENTNDTYLNEREGFYDWSKTHNGRTYYVDLVAAHAVMSFYAVSNVVDNFAEPKNRHRGKNVRIGLHRELVASYDSRDSKMHIQYHIAKEYVSCFKHITSHLSSKGVELKDDFVEAAWWVLVLRAVVWDMSTSGDARFAKRPGKWEGDPVPSYLYDTVMPVWIT